MMLAAILAAAVQAAPADVTLPEGEALDRAVAARSAEYFTLVFQGCDPGRLRDLLAPDFEFYHDRNGFTGSAEPIIARYATRCARRRDQPLRHRRELVAGRQHIDPVPGHGAVEVGDHVFLFRPDDGEWRVGGSGRYLHVWRLVEGSWRLSRAISYDHQSIAPRPDTAAR